MAKDALDDIKMKQMRASAAGQKYSDPSAAEVGFKRDGWETTRFANEARQNEIMMDKMKNAPQEMPQDLLDFLNDGGPLERKVNKERTSSKVYESLKSEQEQVRKEVEETKLRRRRIMPMVEHRSAGQEVEEDGTATSRTTNFSSTNKEEDDQHLRLSDAELFRFLSQLKNNQVTPEEIVTQYYENSEGSMLAQDRKAKHIGSIQNMDKYMGVPVLMEDTDKSIIGAWDHRVEDLKLLRVKIAQENVRLTMDEQEQSFADVLSKQQSPNTVKSEPLLNIKTGGDATREFLKSQKNI